MLNVLAEGVLGHRRGQEAHVQWLCAPPVQQRVDVFGTVVGRRQVQGRPHAQRRPHFPGHGVKPESGNAGGMAARVQVEGLAMPAHQIGHGVVLHHHALGQAGGARGVDHIGKIGGCHRYLWVARQLRRGVVQIDHRHAQYRQAFEQIRLRQHRHRRAVIEQVVQALGGMGRIHRHITSAGLENPQQPHQRLQATPGDDRHTVVRLYPQHQQLMRQGIGPLIQLGVSQSLALVHRSHRMRGQRGLGFDAPVQGLRGRVRLGGGVPALQLRGFLRRYQ